MTVSELLDKVRGHRYRVGVVGLGRVGLPLAIAFARTGVSAIGVDRNEELLATVRCGKMPFREDDDGALQDAIASGTLSVTRDHGALREADVIFITVGTALNTEQRVDYGPLYAVLGQLAPVLHPVQLVIVRSTVAPGTLEKVVKAYIESHTDLRVGTDVLLASVPERIAAGRALTELQTLPEIVGGLDPAATEVAAEVMRTLNAEKIVHHTDPVSAELAKLFTNVYRYVTFAIANEFALLAEHHGRDARDIIHMINEGYPRGGIPLPGPCGGPCLAKDGYLLVEELSFPDFILTAWKLNESIPAYMIGRLRQELRTRGKAIGDVTVGVLGMAFKADYDDLRQSPALRIIELLRREGTNVAAHDPFHDTPDVETVVAGADAVILATNHSAYRTLRPAELLKSTKADCIFVDCWGQWGGAADGVSVLTFGKGTP